jgi:hypothetical protein
MEYTFNTLLSQLTQGVSSDFVGINNSCLNIAYIKAIQAGLCKNDKNKVFTKEALGFILDEYDNQLGQFNK